MQASIPATTLISAAVQASAISAEYIQRRNATINQQLQGKQLRTINVAGDWNCFCRAISVCINGHQDDRVELRWLVTCHIRELSNVVSPIDSVALRQCAANISVDSTWAGEEMSSGIQLTAYGAPFTPSYPRRRHRRWSILRTGVTFRYSTFENSFLWAWPRTTSRQS